MTDRHSRQAVTHYETIREYPGYAHIRLRLETGRTHQIRVHMAYLGHPVAGDVVYGKPLPGCRGSVSTPGKSASAIPAAGHICTLPVRCPLILRRSLSKLPRIRRREKRVFGKLPFAIFEKIGYTVFIV